MKLFFSEFTPDYGKYHFPYQVWLLREQVGETEKIYNSGFLPIRNFPDVYYLCRSLRIDLGKFSPSSENRRILNKTAEFEYKFLPIEQFEYTPEVQKFCKDYINKRFGKGHISAAGIKNIFQKGVYNYVFVWTKRGQEKPVGYAVCFVNDKLLHYAHVFYDLSLSEVHIGIRMILQAVIWSKENSREHVYLGTVYNHSALSYKTEYDGFEFFNGFTWSNNIKELKQLIQRNEEEYLLKDKEYLNDYYNGDILTLMNTMGVRVNI